ncbi:MAG TPA: radical SAM family heme chaperone HemW [Tenericutes bacterium]|nr:radical SAM family heme chaperone HemW [Mycoplasmatota bacterium]
MNSVYIHIPFCSTICSYCDFCKFLYNEEWVEKYLNELEKEIKSKYNGELIKTLYIGGGTPSCLSIAELTKLFEIIKYFNKDINCETTFECNIENINEEKLLFLLNNKVNRLSIGVQTFNDNYLSFLNRKHVETEIKDKIEFAKKIGFDNISIDLIYAIPNQTINELKMEIDKFIELDINHISTYSLIIESNTKLNIDNISNIDEALDKEMYDYITNRLLKKGFNHYEISNFAKPGYESKHNLVYWNNQNYYGFGLGASGYINDIRYENTRSFNNYLNGKYVLNEEVLDKQKTIENEYILGFRKIKGINKVDFYNKFRVDISKNKNIQKNIKEGKIIDDGENIFIKKEYIYISNSILIDFIGDDYE